MMKCVLFSLALLVSFNAFAGSSSNSLSDSISKSLNKQTNSQKDTQGSAIYYGGKDISHPLIASNNSKAGTSSVG